MRFYALLNRMSDPAGTYLVLRENSSAFRLLTI